MYAHKTVAQKRGQRPYIARLGKKGQKRKYSLNKPQTNFYGFISMCYTLQSLYFAFMVYTIIYCSKVKCSLQGLYSKCFNCLMGQTLTTSRKKQYKKCTYFALFRANHKPISKAFCLVCGFWFALKRKTIEYTHNSEN